jgi:hypothetical protein
VDLAGAGVCCGDAGSGVRVRDALAGALMGTGGVVMLLVPGQDGAQCAWLRMRVWSRSSRRRVPVRRSQIAFIRGACTAVRTMVVPVAWKTASKERVKSGPRSRIRNRKPVNRSPRPGAGCGPAAPSSRPSGGR